MVEWVGKHATHMMNMSERRLSWRRAFVEMTCYFPLQMAQIKRSWIIDVEDRWRIRVWHLERKMEYYLLK